MNQQTVLPTSETNMDSEVPGEKKVLPNSVPPAQVIREIASTSKKTISTFVDGCVATWAALPPKRKRMMVLVGLSVFTSVTMSLIAAVIARLVARKERRGQARV